jgi:NAD(P)-dependent dehydrogenase (short-subunit alcohol dehydrogenase family)
MLSVFNLQNKVVVITGGTGVLGSELSRGLARAGAKVAVLGRDAATVDLSKTRHPAWINWRA